MTNNFDFNVTNSWLNATTPSWRGNEFHESMICQPLLTQEKSAHQRELALLERLLQQYQVQVEYLHYFLVFVTILVTLVLSVMAIWSHLRRRFKSNQLRCLEAQNKRYEGILTEKSKRIEQLSEKLREERENTPAASNRNDAEQQQEPNVHAQQIMPQHHFSSQPIVYAFPGIPPSASLNYKG